MQKIAYLLFVSCRIVCGKLLIVHCSSLLQSLFDNIALLDSFAIILHMLSPCVLVVFYIFFVNIVMFGSKIMLNCVDKQQRCVCVHITYLYIQGFEVIMCDRIVHNLMLKLNIKSNPCFFSNLGRRPLKQIYKCVDQYHAQGAMFYS